jgi:hypothetical protein
MVAEAGEPEEVMADMAVVKQQALNLHKLQVMRYTRLYVTCKATHQNMTCSLWQQKPKQDVEALGMRDKHHCGEATEV